LTSIGFLNIIITNCVPIDWLYHRPLGKPHHRPVVYAWHHIESDQTSDEILRMWDMCQHTASETCQQWQQNYYSKQIQSNAVHHFKNKNERLTTQIHLPQNLYLYTLYLVTHLAITTEAHGTAPHSHTRTHTHTHTTVLRLSGFCGEPVPHSILHLQ